MAYTEAKIQTFEKMLYYLANVKKQDGYNGVLHAELDLVHIYVIKECLAKDGMMMAEHQLEIAKAELKLKQDE